MKGAIVCVGLLAFAGCLSPERAEEGANQTAEELTIAAWERAVGVTNIFGIAYGGDPIAPLVPHTNGIVRLSLKDALRVGSKNNRKFRTLKETVFVRALALDSEAYAFSTTFSGMILGALSGDPGIVKESAAFAAGRLVTLGLEEAILWLGITVLGLNDVVVKIIAQVLVIIGNYLISKLFVFRKQ